MSGIHAKILDKIEAELRYATMTSIPDGDPTCVGAIRQGDLQGDPDPDIARISITLYENDPDGFNREGTTEAYRGWMDETEDVEIGGAVTMKRRFTVKARCLLVNTQEDLATTRSIASTIRSRIETTLKGISFAGLYADDGEYVARPILSGNIQSEMKQGGGPNEYDYIIKVRFDVLTTKV